MTEIAIRFDASLDFGDGDLSPANSILLQVDLPEAVVVLDADLLQLLLKAKLAEFVLQQNASPFIRGVETIFVGSCFHFGHYTVA